MELEKNNSFYELKQKISLASQESNTYEKLGKYIEQNFNEVIFMTASEIAAEAGVSQGSVSRFCSFIGYKGYNDFLRELQVFVREELTAPQRFKYTTQDSSGIKEIIDMETNNINQLESILNEPAYGSMVRKIATAKQLVLMSSRMSATLLPYMSYILNKMRDNVVCVTPDSQLWDTVGFKNKEDTEVFAIVFPRYSSKLIAKLQELKEAGFEISAITDRITSPVFNMAQQVIDIPLTSSSIFDIYSTPMLFLNLLLRDVSKEIEGLKERLDMMEAYEIKNSAYFR